MALGNARRVSRSDAEALPLGTIEKRAGAIFERTVVKGNRVVRILDLGSGWKDGHSQ